MKLNQIIPLFLLVLNVYAGVPYVEKLNGVATNMTLANSSGRTLIDVVGGRLQLGLDQTNNAVPYLLVGCDSAGLGNAFFPGYGLCSNILSYDVVITNTSGNGQTPLSVWAGGGQGPFIYDQNGFVNTSYIQAYTPPGANQNGGTLVITGGIGTGVGGTAGNLWLQPGAGSGGYGFVYVGQQGVTPPAARVSDWTIGNGFQLLGDDGNYYQVKVTVVNGNPSLQLIKVGP